MASIFVSALGVLCACANDISKEFVVAASDVHQGSDFQEREADIGDIQGEWHFGDSEAEWSVTIIPYDGGMIVQTSNSFFSDEKQNFIPIYSTTGIQKLENGTFNIAKPSREAGFFKAMLIESKAADPKTGKKAKMLLLDGSSLDSGKGARREAGFFSSTLKESFGDRYALSCTILGEDDLKGKSTAELTLMRNSIFARYGMIFSDPTLKKHFSKQDWYRPWKTDVTDCITELEWINIRAIQKQEKSEPVK